ncbi:Do family serine endopeptidase [Falsiruegeria mediterranea]|uniref:Probable periplasmic serine endoprotease DegP-like n=1 Tax=Falsiruegeria mediterranea M17 TaxID=1200281 RepID=A0A2R8CB99_9RHOB|nr:Do family serine endopeptidase [Falsiruegeria mediterranea]SPJ29702.1 Periplasmic serine endoprotease DegP [Falsiruegeria mediterranea M17]
MSIRNTTRLTAGLPGWAGASALSALLLATTALPAAADEALADLVEEVGPSVVTILATQEAMTEPASMKGRGMENHPFGEFFRQFGMPEGMKPGPRGPSQGLGSGFILEEDGLIVTNHHVIDGADTVTVRLADDREFEATVVGADPLTDLAVLQIDAGGPLPAVELGDSDVIRVGEDVVAVGNPFGLSSTVTTGIVSAKGRNISEGPYAEFIQTDAAINKGNSGGPLFNMDGEVIGVNSAIYSPTGGSVGLGFAVTSNIAETIVADLIDDGQVDRGWLGVSIQNVSPDIAAAMGLDGATGALVSDVVTDSPADGALKSGDVILSFDGKPVKSSADLPRLVGATKTGTDSTIEVLRNGEPEQVTVTIGTHQMASAQIEPQVDETSGKQLGVTVAPLTDTARAEIGISKDVSGVVVTSLNQEGAAAKAGLRVGDVIVKLGSQDTLTPKELKAALKSEKTDPALVLINRGGNQLFVAVEIA